MSKLLELLLQLLRVKSKAQWDVTADHDSDDSMSIALSSGDESELEIFITSGVKYLEQLQLAESDPASKAFILWSTRDFVNIPLVRNCEYIHLLTLF